MLLATYNPEGRPWNQIEDDGWLYGRIAYHLTGAERQTELRSLLLDFDWLQAKLGVTGVEAVLADFDFLTVDATLVLVQDTLRQCAHVLAMDLTQLRSQLCGRLVGADAPEIKALLGSASARAVGLWLQPLAPSLRAPTALLRTLRWGKGWVNTLAVLPDGRIVSAGFDGTVLRCWDATTGELKGFLQARGVFCQDVSVNAIAVLPDGILACGLSDGGINLWDCVTSELKATFGARLSPVTALAWGQRTAGSHLDWPTDKSRSGASRPAKSRLPLGDIEVASRRLRCCPMASSFPLGPDGIVRYGI